MLRTIAVAALPALLSLSVPFLAQTTWAGEGSAQAVLQAMLEQDYSCSPDEAVEIDLPSLLTDRDRYADRCVRVSGIVAGRWFLSSLHELDALKKLDTSVLVERVSAIMGLQLQGPEPFPALEGRAEVTGRLRSCGKRYAMFQAAEDERAAASRQQGDARWFVPVMLSGTCHYMGWAIFSSVWRPSP